jgi:two-component system chemotaxis response regulator CheY
MQTQSLMLRVSPEQIRSLLPAPYDIYSGEGILLLAKGELVPDPAHAAILGHQGWRLAAPGEAIPAEQDDDADRLPLDVQLPFRGRPPLSQVEALVAEDMAVMRRLLAHMLREQGIQKIEVVDDGAKAVANFFRYRPHIVFLDIDMPVANGLSALKQIKRWSPQTFVCMVSANSTLINVKEAKEQGVNAFLVKPISPLNLQRVLNLYRLAGEGAAH